MALCASLVLLAAYMPRLCKVAKRLFCIIFCHSKLVCIIMSILFCTFSLGLGRLGCLKDFETDPFTHQ
jgi:hypothetical protein